ncbi:hypothetical protein CYMTET_11577 [Cymbomonas tetramitiformis]|uniref:Uncharacterized protein n=1 Tax=Cymbomonas tetramitiformis TaxID=36881 RepID=A0AAE0GM24_9CHLO|nr:hypothetical protein CYMTET_11577 [Cymbomonas tetramitiformis]
MLVTFSPCLSLKRLPEVRVVAGLGRSATAKRTLQKTGVRPWSGLPTKCKTIRYGTPKVSAALHSDLKGHKLVESFSVVLSAAVLQLSFAAHAVGPVNIALSNLRAETIECPAGQNTMTMGAPRCIEVTADSENKKDIPFSNVDVFGRVFVNGENALDRDEASDAGRIANIAEVPAGKGVVTFRLIVSERQARSGELQFKSFKAKAYPGSGMAGLSPIIDVEDCDDFAREIGECAQDDVLF